MSDGFVHPEEEKVERDFTAFNYPKEAIEMEPDTSQTCTKNGQEATDTSWNKGNSN